MKCLLSNFFTLLTKTRSRASLPLYLYFLVLLLSYFLLFFSAGELTILGCREQNCFSTLRGNYEYITYFIPGVGRISVIICCYGKELVFSTEMVCCSCWLLEAPNSVWHSIFCFLWVWTWIKEGCSSFSSLLFFSSPHVGISMDKYVWKVSTSWVFTLLTVSSDTAMKSQILFLLLM